MTYAALVLLGFAAGEYVGRTLAQREADRRLWHCRQWFVGRLRRMRTRERDLRRFLADTAAAAIARSQYLEAARWRVGQGEN